MRLCVFARLKHLQLKTKALRIFQKKATKLKKPLRLYDFSRLKHLKLKTKNLANFQKKIAKLKKNFATLLLARLKNSYFTNSIALAKASATPFAFLPFPDAKKGCPPPFPSIYFPNSLITAFAFKLFEATNSFEI